MITRSRAVVAALKLTLPKKFLTILVTVVLFAATPADAGNPRKWSITKTYDRAAAAVLVGHPEDSFLLVGACAATNPAPADRGCVRFELTGRERAFELEIVDATGLPVAGAMVDANGHVLDVACGATDGRVPIDFGGWIDVWLSAGTCPSPLTTSVPTSGSVTITFHR